MKKLILLSTFTAIFIHAAPKASDFEGIWRTTYGMMRLNTEAGKISGIYSYSDQSSLNGEFKDNKFVFSYTEGGENEGEGFLELSADGQKISGKWKSKGAKKWSGNWTGEKVHARKGKKWLVVLEAYWEKSLNEKEHSWGDILKSYFKRFENAEMRHRFFTDETSIKKWIREVAFIPEPVVLLISSHGQKTGVTVNGKTIKENVFTESLKPLKNLQLVHFASCLVMDGSIPQKVLDSKPAGKFPISGYTTSVDWTQSAVMELIYLSFLFESRLSPEKAAEKVSIVFPTATKSIKGSPYINAGFKIVSPKAK